MTGTRMWTVCLLTFVGMSLVANACTVPLPQPPMWVLDEGMQDGKDVFLIGVELGPLFVPDPETGTTCACGLNFSSPLPFGSNVTDAFVAVTDRNTHAMQVLPEFDFTPKTNTTSGLRNRTESFNWFGLATTAIDTVTQPVLGSDEALKLWFRVEIDENIGEFEFGEDADSSHVEFDADTFFSPDNLTFAAGSAQTDGTPNFGGDHPMILFDAVAIPEPSTILLAAFAGLALFGRKGR